MSQNSLFHIKIPEGNIVQFEQESTFENFIGQFQAFCPKLLCVVDGTCLRYYDNPVIGDHAPGAGTLPNNLRFDYKQKRGVLTEYYFRDIGTDSLYCVFGREAAKIFYPRIDHVDPLDPRTQSERPGIRHRNSDIIAGQPHHSKLPLDRTKLSTFQTPNKNPTNALSNANSLATCDPRLAIIQSNNAIIDTPKVPRTGVSSSNTTHNIHDHLPKNSLHLSDTKASDHFNRKKTLITKLEHGTTSHGRIVSKLVTDRSHPPDHISIIDKGVKFIFPNSNYPVEIRTHYPR